MHERLGVPQEEVKDYNRFLYSTYGTSLAGLVVRGGRALRARAAAAQRACLPDLTTCT